MIEKKEFVVVALDLKHEIFVIYITSFTSFDSSIHLSYRPQIAGLISKNSPQRILAMTVLRINMKRPKWLQKS